MEVGSAVEEITGPFHPAQAALFPADAAPASAGSDAAGFLPTRMGVMVYGPVLVGPQRGDVIFKAQAPTAVFTVPRPIIVQLQPRQSDNEDFGFPDQFALTVIETDFDFVRFRVRRLDANANPIGWGQDLQVDIFCIDDGTEPPFGG